MTIGESLKRARKKMGLELDDVVRSTKIAKMFLIALENDDISSLPQGVYTRNFLRTYARFLNLDEDILTAEFHEQYSIKPQFVHQKEQTKLDNINFVRRRNRRMIALFVLVIVPSILFFLYWHNQESVNTFFYELTGGQPSSKSAPVTGSPLAEINKLNEAPPEPEEPFEVDPQPLEEAPAAATARDEREPASTGNDEASPSALNRSEPEPAPDAAETTESSEPADSGETVAEVAQTSLATLPLTSLDGVVVHPRSNQATELSDTFTIAARAPIWLYVEIDGVEVTNRQLSAGEMRCYRYGTRQTVNIGDVYQVSVQSGQDYRERASDQRVFVKIVDFQKGQFFEALDQAVLDGLEAAKKMREE